MPTDEPSLTDVLQGVKKRQDATDIAVMLILILAGTAWGWYHGLQGWQMYPPLFAALFFGFDGILWYYYDYRPQRLREKGNRIATGEDIDPALEMGPGITSPFVLSLLGSQVAWGLVVIYALPPTDTNTRLLIFFIGYATVSFGVGTLFKSIIQSDD
jgi:hypothetical protein